MSEVDGFDAAFAEVLEEIFGWDVVLTEDDGPASVADWSSLAQIRLVHALESRFDVLLPDSALLEEQTVGSLKALVSELRSAAG